MPGPFVHRIDPVLLDAGGVYLWWYGLSYTLGFLGVHLWFRRRRARLSMTLDEVYRISLYLGIAVLLGGRFVEIVFYEWPYYSRHPGRIPMYWLGGMSTHGLLLGAVLGTWLFCRKSGRNFFDIADQLVVPGAWVMGLGRIGNFIDGQISGALTDAWCGVQFPDLDGFRHPVVLYDGLKNLMLIPLLAWILSRRPPRGAVFGHFVFWYAFLRIFIDLFREYRVETWGLGTGQLINIGMALCGLALLGWSYRNQQPPAPAAPGADPEPAHSGLRAATFALLLLFCLTLPSDWTQDIPERYGERHSGLRHSLLYPPVKGNEPGD